jgi:hypothetical protein
MEIKGYFRSIFSSNGFSYIPYESNEDDLFVLHQIDENTLDVYEGGKKELIVRLKNIEKKPIISNENDWNDNQKDFWGTWESKNIFDRKSQRVLSSNGIFGSEEFPDSEGGEGINQAYTTEITYFTAREKELKNILFLTLPGQSNPIRYELVDSKLNQHHGGKNRIYSTYERKGL